MEPFTTYSKGIPFSLAYSVYQGTSFDNEEALGVRMVLVFIDSGSGIALINDKAVPYRAPCILCVNDTEHIVITESQNSRVKVIYFHPCIINGYLDFENIRDLPKDVFITVLQDKDMLRHFLKRDDDCKGRFSLGPQSGKKVSALIDILQKQSIDQDLPNWPCRTRSFIMEVLFLLDNLYYADNLGNEIFSQTLDEDFYPILAYLHNNYDKKITVGEITEQFHISKSTIAKRFKENVGESFLEYLNKLRINMAATLLRDTKLPISEIMYRVGFSDQVHFLRTFKRYIKETPSIYREKYNWM